MNMKTETAKLQSLISHALVGSAPPLQFKSTVMINEESVHLGSNFMSAVYCYGHFLKPYFGNYTTNSKEYLVVTYSMYRKLTEYFAQRSIDFRTEKDKAFVDSDDGKTNYEEDLMKPEETVTPEKFPFPMVMTEWGYMPRNSVERPTDPKDPNFGKGLDYSVKLYVRAADLRFPKSVEDATYEYADGKLKLKIESVGRIKQEVEILGKSPETEGKASFIKVKSSLMFPLLSCLEGNVWMMINQRAMIITETDDHHSLTYIIASRKS